MADTINVSIIIPAYNVGKYIGLTLDSCIEQDLEKIEIIVVNDGSYDNTLEIIRKKAATCSIVSIIDKKNGGVTAARQEGLDIAKGEFTFFLDGDDRIANKSVIRELYEKALKEDADYVSGDFILAYPDGRMITRHFKHYDSHTSQEAIRYSFRENDFYYTGRLFRTSLIRQVNEKIPKDITYGEDTYAVVNLLTIIRKACHIELPVIEYVQRSESVTNRLSVHDINKRNKATNLTLSLAKSLDFKSFAEEEIYIFVYRELAQSILLGVPNLKLSESFLPSFKLWKKRIRKALGYKYCFILFASSVNMRLTCALINALKKMR